MTFEEYVSSRGPALVRLARLLTGDPHRAEDLTQDVLARAYVHWRRIARADRPDVYVRRMLVNANRSWWRRRSNRELVVDGFGEQAGRADVGGEAADRDELWRLILLYPQLGQLELLGLEKAHLTASYGWPSRGFTEADAATVLGGAVVADDLTRPDTWN
ncbi:sigma factor [Micromonospora sp. NPDC051925]|uniref:sigma factor n=1 Tax=Micromonospora sp. NPDC051925 TaxID=3364288 RepID=UPI0037C512C6